MRICFVTGEYPPDRGGVADYTACLAAALAARGVAVDVLTRRRDAGPAPGPEPGEARRIAVYRAVPAWGVGALRGVGRMVSLTQPDFVHVQYQAAAFQMRPAIHAVPLWLGLTRRCHVAVTFHDLRVPYLFPKAGPLRPRAVRFLARHADIALATNAEDFSELALDRRRGRLEIVPIGSNVPDAPPEGFDRAAWRAGAGIPPGATVMAYFGFLNASKGGRVLVDALAALRAEGRDARLVMLGEAVGASDPTNAGYLEAFRADLAAAGLEPAVVWTGHLPAPDVSAWLHAADVVTLPYADGASYRRGSLLAALAHARPIVTTTPAPLTGGVLPALEDRAAALLVPPGDAAALARAVAAVGDDPALAGRLSAGALDVAGHFTWEGIAARHLALYRSVVAEGEE